MVSVTFTTDELELMRTIVDRCRQELLFEIANTDSTDFKAFLRERDIAIESILDRIAGALEKASPVSAQA